MSGSPAWGGGRTPWACSTRSSAAGSDWLVWKREAMESPPAATVHRSPPVPRAYCTGRAPTCSRTMRARCSRRIRSRRRSTTPATDREAVAAMDLLCRTEGIIPALEQAHALAWIARERVALAHKTVVMFLSGRGDQDVAQGAAG